MKMMVVFNHPDMRFLTSETVWFLKDDSEMERAMMERDVRLGLGNFVDNIPTATRVELYEKIGTSYELRGEWDAPKTREQAIVDFYRNVGAQVQKEFFNSPTGDE
jgi:hypothetical protein